MIRFDRRKAMLLDTEQMLTPLEVQDFIRKNPETADLFYAADLLRTQPPKRFLREPITDDVQLFSARHGAKKLIVAFCGKVRRLMVPLSHFLQMIDDSSHDVLVLSDRRQLHYDRGIDGFADSFPDLVSRIRTFASSRAYESIVTYGTSMGGFPALRAGIALGASRAVSVGGRFCWHVQRLRDGGDAIGAFDPLCACRGSRSVPLVVAYASQNVDDVQSTRILTRILPGCILVPVETESHNVLDHLNSESEGRLADFYRRWLMSDPQGSWPRDARAGALPDRPHEPMPHPDVVGASLPMAARV